MFSKTNDLSRPPGEAKTTHKSVLAADIKITGDIRSTGTVEILGEIEGTLQAHTVIIGADGQMTGDISAVDLEVKGRHTGRVASTGFTLRSSGQVKADVGYSTLSIESGAQIEGRFMRNPA